MKAFLKYYVKDHLLLLRSKLRLKLSKEVPVLVYTMAKVGSLSIYSSIKKQTTIPCFHIHSLNVEEHEMAKKLCLDQGLFPDSRSPASFILSQIIKPGKPYKVISLFRDPIERNISAFFDAFELYVGVHPNQYSGNIEDLIQCFHEKLPHEYVTQWFQEKFERDTGINVYDFPFNMESGFQYINKGNVELLLLNSTLDDVLKEEHIAKHISMKSFRLSNTNITSNKVKGNLYQDFKNTIRFDKAYLDTLLNSEYCRHFFSRSDIEKMYKKWLMSV